MFRCATPTLEFEIDTELDLTTVTDIWITIRSKGYKSTYKLSKNQVILDADKSTASLDLSQEETLKFMAGVGEVQLKFLTNTDKVYPSDILELNIMDVLNEDIMNNE